MNDKKQQSSVRKPLQKSMRGNSDFKPTARANSSASSSTINTQAPQPAPSQAPPKQKK